MTKFLIAIVGWAGLFSFLAFTFRQGLKVKPDKNRRIEDWRKITLDGSGG